MPGNNAHPYLVIRFAELHDLSPIITLINSFPFSPFMESKATVGLTAPLTIINGEKRSTLIARVDTGATKSSIDQDAAHELRLGPALHNHVVKSAHGVRQRPIIAIDVEVGGKKLYKVEFSVIDRSHMRYKALIGQNILKKGFMIDPHIRG